jgi:chorismate dehydratase
VFAFWAVRQAALNKAPRDLDLAAVFQESRNHGLMPNSLDVIAREWAPRLALSHEEVKSYLTDNIYYSLDLDCLDGMSLFYQLAYQCGALPAVPPLSFLDAAKAVVI